MSPVTFYFISLFSFHSFSLFSFFYLKKEETGHHVWCVVSRNLRSRDVMCRVLGCVLVTARTLHHFFLSFKPFSHTHSKVISRAAEHALVSWMTIKFMFWYLKCQNCTKINHFSGFLSQNHDRIMRRRSGGLQKSRLPGDLNQHRYRTEPH